METAVRRDDLLEQIRSLPIEDRDYIETALMREAYEQGRRAESPDELAEICSERTTLSVIAERATRAKNLSIGRARRSTRSVLASREGLPRRGDRPDRVRGSRRLVREPEVGLGLKFIAEIDRVLAHIAHQESFATAPIATAPGGVVRREFAERFPYIVVFVDTPKLRRVIMIRRGSSSPTRWRSRL